LSSARKKSTSSTAIWCTRSPLPARTQRSGTGCAAADSVGAAAAGSRRFKAASSWPSSEAGRASARRTRSTVRARRSGDTGLST
jgi:hypothetical protein